MCDIKSFYHINVMSFHRNSVRHASDVTTILEIILCHCTNLIHNALLVHLNVRCNVISSQ